MEKNKAQRIGKYTVLRKIGQGAMANVYLCMDQENYVSVAVKELKVNLRTPEHLDMFKSEVDISRKMMHPNITKVFHGEENYLAMEFVNGESLDAHDNVDNLLPLKTILSALSQSAKALKFSSEKGIIHRDVKPANIILDKNGNVKLTDFGCAILEGEFETSVAGSLSYMSPEQLSGEALDFRADMYSLGMVAFRLLTGRCAFRADNSHDLKIAILNFKPEKLENCRKGLPLELIELVEKSISADKNKRYDNWSGFIDRVEKLSHAVAIGQYSSVDDMRGLSESAFGQYAKKFNPTYDETKYSISRFSMSAMKI